MNTGLAIALGVIAGFLLASQLQTSSKCCAALGKAALGKYNLPDLGQGVDGAAGGIIAELGLT